MGLRIWNETKLFLCIISVLNYIFGIFLLRLYLLYIPTLCIFESPFLISLATCSCTFIFALHVVITSLPCTFVFCALTVVQAIFSCVSLRGRFTLTFTDFTC